jgi:hypothetical protein
LDAWAISAQSAENGRRPRRLSEQCSNNPSDLTALSNLGTLLAKEGKLNDGEALLDEAFDRNKDIRAWP